jgi:Tol biopolymer transport system component/DNA-binding winged helix-turn-helix (wHTH) protein
MLARAMQMLGSTKTPSRVTFGLFEADLKSGELRKAGNRVKLQALPFKVLTVLLENAGEVVSREELQIRVWGPDVIVDFEHSLSNAIKKLREALGDSADNPRFIETLSRRGFRFIAPVDFADGQSTDSPDSIIDTPIHRPGPENQLTVATAEPKIERPTLVRGWSRYLFPALFFGLGALLVGSAFLFWNARRPSAVLPRMSQITQDDTIYASKDHLLGARSAFVTDGIHLFTPSNENGRVVLSQISLSTGTSQAIPLLSEIGTPEVEDISPDGTKLLVRSKLASATQQPLWIVPVDGGSAFKVSNVLVQDATWMPDGRSILYTSGNQLFVVSPEDGRSTVFATVAGPAFWPRWSPDGKVLRFTIINPIDHTSSLWEISQDNRTAHPILRSFNNSVRECCGIWTADGKFFVFEATQDSYTDLWKVNASLNSSPARITNGPLNYQAPASGRTGEQIFFVGQDVHSLLERYDPRRKEYVPQQGFLAAADHITFSHDGRWVAWADANHRLWRARIDGTDKVLLTPASMWVFMDTWSPDDTRIAFMAREPRQPWQIYTVNTDGGPPERLLQEDHNIGDPSFSADGKYLVFGTVPELMAVEKTPTSLEIMELATHHVTEVPNSRGLYSPRWSPDGRFIAAITLDQKQLMLYDMQTKIWKTLAVTSAANPVWSKDSKALYIHAYRAENRPIIRVSVPEGKMEEIANLNNFRSGNVTHDDFAGITLDDLPLMHAEISSGNLYTIDLGQK